MKIDRLIGITMYLLNREQVSASALAKRFEVSRRTIQRDIETLNKAGIPIVATYGAEGGYEIMDGFRLTKQIASVDDYLNLIIAIKGLSTAYENDKVNATLEKVLASMQGGEQRVFVNFSSARENRAVNGYLLQIEQAVEQKIRLRIEYSNADSHGSTRIVEPLALSFQWYAWYLFAYCEDRQAYRMFKLPRIIKCEPVPGAFSKDHGNVELLMQREAAEDTRPYYDIRVLCKPEIRQQALEYLSDEIVEERENGEFVLAMHVPMERMWFSLLMGFGDKVTVLAPEEIRTMLRERAEEILRST